VTAAVAFVVTPNCHTNATATIIYTNSAMTASGKASPRVTPTDNEGADLTSLTVGERFLCAGDPVVFTVSDTLATVTGVTFRAWLKVE